MSDPQQQQQQQQQPAIHHGLGGSQFGDTTLTKIFVGGLAWETQRDTMRQYFEQFGDILEAVVITDKNTGRSKGYGFVTFKDPESARRACENPTPIIDGRRANCNLAALGVRPRFPPFHQGARIRHFTPVNLGSNSQLPGNYSTPPSSTFPQVPAQYSYPQAGFSYAPYGYTYVPSEYSYQSLYNPYGNPTQLSAVYGSSSGSSTISNPAAVYTYSGFNQMGSNYPPGGPTSPGQTFPPPPPPPSSSSMQYPAPPPPPPLFSTSALGGFNSAGSAGAASASSSVISPASAGGASATGVCVLIQG